MTGGRGYKTHDMSHVNVTCDMSFVKKDKKNKLPEKSPKCKQM